MKYGLCHLCPVDTQANNLFANPLGDGVTQHIPVCDVHYVTLALAEPVEMVPV